MKRPAVQNALEQQHVEDVARLWSVQGQPRCQRGSKEENHIIGCQQLGNINVDLDSSKFVSWSTFEEDNASRGGFPAIYLWFPDFSHVHSGIQRSARLWEGQSIIGLRVHGSGWNFITSKMTTVKIAVRSQPSSWPKGWLCMFHCNQTNQIQSPKSVLTNLSCFHCVKE